MGGGSKGGRCGHTSSLVIVLLAYFYSETHQRFIGEKISCQNIPCWRKKVAIQQGSTAMCSKNHAQYTRYVGCLSIFD